MTIPHHFGEPNIHRQNLCGNSGQQRVDMAKQTNRGTMTKHHQFTFDLQDCDRCNCNVTKEKTNRVVRRALEWRKRRYVECLLILCLESIDRSSVMLEQPLWALRKTIDGLTLCFAHVNECPLRALEAQGSEPAGRDERRVGCVRSETKNLLHTLYVSSRSPLVFNSHSEEIAAQLDLVTDACGPRSNCTPVYICLSSEHNYCKEELESWKTRTVRNHIAQMKRLSEPFRQNNNPSLWRRDYT